MNYSYDSITHLRSKVMRNLIVFLFAGFLLFSLYGDEQDTWHHGTSDYRAIFNYSGNAPPQTGVLLQVPVCSLGDSEGRDLFCFDQRGKQLLSSTVGAAIGNSVIVACRPDSGTQRILVYFGSGSRAPQARIPIHGGLLGEVRALPAGAKVENWPELSKELNKCPIIGRFLPEQWAQVSNPVDSRQEFHHDRQRFFDDHRRTAENLVCQCR